MAATRREMKNKRAVITLLVCVIILLSACSGRTDLTLYPEERWVVSSTCSFDRRLVPELAFGLQVSRLIGLNVGLGTRDWGLAALESGLDALVAHYRANGVDASWAKRSLPWGPVRYTLTARGEGWDKLQQIAPAVFDVDVSDAAGDAVRLSLRSSTMEGGFGGTVPLTFRLHGRQIVSSNADEAMGGTATWHRLTGPIEAVVIPASEQNVVVPLLVGTGVLLVAGATGAGTFLYCRRRAKPGGTQRPQRPVRPSTWRRRPWRWP
jgi:hypothetical protein